MRCSDCTAAAISSVAWVRWKLQKIGDSFEEREVDPFIRKATQLLRLYDIYPLGMGELLDSLMIILVLLDDRHSQHLTVHDHNRRSSCIIPFLRGLGGLSSFFLVVQNGMVINLYLSIKADKREMLKGVGLQ